MKPRGPAEVGAPDRMYLVTSGRTEGDAHTFDLVTLIVRESAQCAGLSSEHRRILDLSRHPIAVVELSAELGLPVAVTRILLDDLLATGRISARRPRLRQDAPHPDIAILREVLHGLRNL